MPILIQNLIGILFVVLTGPSRIVASMDLRDGGRPTGGMFALYVSHYSGNRKYYVHICYNH